MDPYTSGRYSDRNPDWHEADAPHKARSLLRAFRYCGLQPRTVLDVGCGTGAVLRHLKEELDGELPDTTWEGWDIAPEAIKRARTHEGGRLMFVCDDFLRSERRADLLLCIDVIEHVADDLGFLRQLRTRAAWALFRIPLDLSALDVLRPRRLVEARHQWGHRHFYTREMAIDLLRTAGYRVESEFYDRVPLERGSLRQRFVDQVRRSAFRSAPDRAVRALGGYSLVVCAKADG